MHKQINKPSLPAILALSLSCSLALLMSACGGGGSDSPAAVTPVPSFTKAATLTTAQELPAPVLPDTAAATPGGTASFTLYSSNKLRGSMTLTGFTISATTSAAAVNAAHIHDGDIGTPGGVVVGLVPDAAKVVWSLPANTVLTDAQVARFKAGGYYVNAHTATNAAGVVRGQLISFADNIQPIFTASCAFSGCHVTGGLAPMSLAAGAALGNLVNVATVTSSSGGKRVVAGNSGDSVLVKRLNGTTPPQMPLNNTPLTTGAQNLIKVWIDMGANNN
jgi:hypothetical protein